MRKNLFLHFLNRDSREIFGLFKFHAERQHIALLKEALNMSVLLCEDNCVIPPGFVIEDEIAFELWEVNRAFLANRLILLPMRESSLTTYAEKKRLEYSPQRDRYSGLYNDRRLEFLGSNAVGLVPRKSHIAEQIADGWLSAADGRGKLWANTKKIISPPVIEVIRNLPKLIVADGLAITWAEISPRLPREANPAHPELRNSLQHVYFKQYCKEFDLRIMCELPFVHDEFGLPTDRDVYNFTRFSAFLEAFSLKKLLTKCSAEALSTIKRKPGSIAFIDAYQGVAQMASSRADLVMIAQRATQSSLFDWGAFSARNQFLRGEPDGLAIAELDDALNEVASHLVNQNGLNTRLTQIQRPRSSKANTRRIEVTSLPDILLYVALEEELKVLVEHFSLNRQTRNPIATGNIGGQQVAVISPLQMGRVPAAVEVARYLESRKEHKPKLIIIIGLAGGFEEQGTKQGHVLCGTVCVDLASRKVERDSEELKTKFRRMDFQLDDSLAAVLRSGAFDKGAWIDEAIKQARWPEDRRPSLHFGPIASVDEVVASNDWRKELLKNNDKLLGVEMEAGGVCAAANTYKVPVSMLRVVSDNADPIKTDDSWRHLGMLTIALLLQRLSFKEVVAAMNP